MKEVHVRPGDLISVPNSCEGLHQKSSGEFAVDPKCREPELLQTQVAFLLPS
jgi:hypothetical protein